METIIDHERHMRVALGEAEKAALEGNSGVGSVVVRDGEVVGLGRNLVYTTFDVSAHAETVALRDAGKALRMIEFSGCTLYTTFEPCPMCCGAILLSGVGALVMGGRNDPQLSSWMGYRVEDLISHLRPDAPIRVITGVLEAEGFAVLHRGR